MAKRATPLTVFGARTPEEYRELHKRSVAKSRLTPTLSTTTPPVLVESDGLRILCACGDYPIVDADWKMACCFRCGLVYEGLDVPEGQG